MRIYFSCFSIFLLFSLLIQLSHVVQAVKSHGSLFDINNDTLRLPTDLAPTHYNLSIKVYVPGYVDFSSKLEHTFEANITIHFLVLNATDKIVLHSQGLEFPSDLQELCLQPGNIAVKSIEHQEDVQKVIFALSSPLKKGQKYEFHIPYKGFVRKVQKYVQPKGIFYDSYINSKGVNRHLVATQFEPADARTMVPCFDEPSYKAIWTVTIIHPNGTTSVSNAATLETIDQGLVLPFDKTGGGRMLQFNPPGFTEVDHYRGSWLTSNFDKTPQMSSYLLALVISDFSYKETKFTTSDGRNVRNMVSRGFYQKADFSLQVAVTAMKMYEQMFQAPFPLSKLDMVAVRAMHGLNMENWGLVIFDENILLQIAYSKAESTNVIAHELAHQWFGDLVTTKWWNNLFLNERFATFMSYKPMAKAMNDPTYNVSEDFIQSVEDLGFAIDSEQFSHPISQEPDIAPFGGDAITYKKGASVLRMFEQAMGEENFKNGLQIYLQAHKFGNVDYKDLLKALSKTAPVSVKPSMYEFAEPWLIQSRYPVVTVKKVDSTHVELSQHSCAVSSAIANETNRHSGSRCRWTIDKREKYGFYKNNYDSQLLKQISSRMMSAHETIAPVTRAQLIQDAVSSAEAGLVPYSSALDVMSYWKKNNTQFR